MPACWVRRTRLQLKCACSRAWERTRWACPPSPKYWLQGRSACASWPSAVSPMPPQASPRIRSPTPMYCGRRTGGARVRARGGQRGSRSGGDLRRRNASPLPVWGQFVVVYPTSSTVALRRRARRVTPQGRGRGQREGDLTARGARRPSPRERRGSADAPLARWAVIAAERTHPVP